MGITPITNLTPLPVARAILADLDPRPMERVEKPPRSGDETYSPSGGKSTRGSEDDASEEDGFVTASGELNDETGTVEGAEARDSGQQRAISFFA
jgi:hypothetical protein